MTTSPQFRHDVFVSFQHADQRYKDKLIRIMGNRIVNRSVNNGDIDSGQNLDKTRMEIREEHIQKASVTVVLIGPCTWQRKHVDWEIDYSLRQTDFKPERNGLLGIILPNHPNFRRRPYQPKLIPRRLADNCDENHPYAKIYYWTELTDHIGVWIDRAFDTRNSVNPDNSRTPFGSNHNRPCDQGWTD